MNGHTIPTTTTTTQPSKLRVVIGSDEAGATYNTLIASDLTHSPLVCTLLDIGVPSSTDSTPYPTIALHAARLIATGQADRAILVCGTGLGVAIAANKVPGVRAVTAHDGFSVERAVLSNNAQVLCLGERVVGREVARRLVGEFLGWRFDEGSGSREKVRVMEEWEGR